MQAGSLPSSVFFTVSHTWLSLVTLLSLSLPLCARLLQIRRALHTVRRCFLIVQGSPFEIIVGDPVMEDMRGVLHLR